MVEIQWHFDRHGCVPLLSENEIAVDSGSPIKQERVFDHHDHTNADSSLEVLMNNKNILESMKTKEKVTIHCHLEPDLDCAVSSFYAIKIFIGEELDPKRSSLLNKLMKKIDQGKISPLPGSLRSNEFSINIYNFFLYLNNFIEIYKDKYYEYLKKDLRDKFIFKFDWKKQKKAAAFELYMLYSYVLLDSVCNLDEDLFQLICSPGNYLMYFDELVKKSIIGKCAEKYPNISPVFVEIFREIDNYIEKTKSELKNNNDFEFFEINISETKKAICLRITASWITIPILKTYRNNRTGSFKLFGKDDKAPIDILVFIPENDFGRVVFSVDPESGISLKGLGLALDRAENEKRNYKEKKSRYRRKINGIEVGDPLFPYFDPWYDGRGHDWTIVDAPKSTRTSSNEEILDIFKKTKWYKDAEDYKTLEYENWLKGELVY